MEFRISDTFTDSLTKLQAKDQKAVKTTAFDLQVDPSSPGLKFHRIDRSKDPNFWSIRVNRDIRLVVHKTAASLLLCYVDHHDDAYAWAERRRIERHPKTGAAQLVEVRETVEEVKVYKPIEEEAVLAEPIAPKPSLFSDVSDDDLLGYGVPADWLDDVKAANEDTLFDLAERLPQEAAEALLDIAVGVTPQVAIAAATEAEQFDHPDAQRRFRLMSNVEELERALDYPWERWTVFLHPAQSDFVERDYNGPVCISGSAGTGKTVVALHRAAFLARQHPQSKILLTTFSQTLANQLAVKLDRLIGNEPVARGRISVHPISKVGYELYTELFGEPNLAPANLIQELLAAAATEVEAQRFTPAFLAVEWENVVDAWQLETWEDYRDVARLGRKTRIGGKQRKILWSIFERVREELRDRNLVTSSQILGRLGDEIGKSESLPFDFVVVDEAQDIGVAEIRFLSALGKLRSDCLFFASDLGQRIFQQPFSWKVLGIDIGDRSHTLRINYRTSHQIRSQADRLLPGSLADVDGNEETRKGMVSVFNGPAPEIQVCDSEKEEEDVVSTWIKERMSEGVLPQEIGVFVRSKSEMDRARKAVNASDSSVIELSDTAEATPDQIAIGTMHLAKGLEFKAIVVMACDDEVLPLQSRIESVSDTSDLDDVYNTERHLLYVACTRARDHLLVTGVNPASEFLDDLVG